MSSTYHMMMPLMICNLGVEIIYLLTMRIRAQRIGEDTLYEKINAIVKAIFDRKIMDEMKKKQKIAKEKTMKKLLLKFVESDLKLSKSSKETLWEFVMLSLKCQILRTNFPEEIYQITMTHLNSLLEFLQKGETKDPKALDLVRENINSVENNYDKIGAYDYFILRQTMLQFFHERNFQIAIFARDGLQSKDGVLYLPRSPMAPPEVNIPGSSLKYTKDGFVEKTYNLHIKTAENFQKSIFSERVKINSTKLGKSLYDEHLKRINLNGDNDSEETYEDNESKDLNSTISEIGQEDLIKDDSENDAGYHDDILTLSHAQALLNGNQFVEFHTNNSVLNNKENNYEVDHHVNDVNQNYPTYDQINVNEAHVNNDIFKKIGIQ